MLNSSELDVLVYAATNIYPGIDPLEIIIDFWKILNSEDPKHRYPNQCHFQLGACSIIYRLEGRGNLTLEKFLSKISIIGPLEKEQIKLRLI